MQTPKRPEPERTPQQNPSYPPDPGQQNPIPGKDNPSDTPRPGTDPKNPIDIDG
jgi:hypothetical protein